MADDPGNAPNEQGLKDINTTLQSLVRYSGLTIQTLQNSFPGQFVLAPANATAIGKPNQVAFDATHFYVCIATNSWIRANFAAW